MKIAVEGCAHGELEKIYDTLTAIEERENIKIDLLICCGDFQSTRNLEDLQTMAVPEKYLDICTFYKYYSGEKVAPVLTIFIGGNHEASNYLQELPYGGWVAPKIYYLGYAGVVRVNGLRIGGISGIYKGHDYLRGHHEFAPYSQQTMRSVYHVRQLEVFRLKQLSGDVDIFLSHDWPKGIYNYGNHTQLVRFKPYFKEEIEGDRLGSPPCEDLLKTLKPTFYFAAHLHCKFAALVPHEDADKTTKFLALDKCLPKRRFLQIVDMEAPDGPGDGEVKFQYDLEWLTILHNTNHLISVKSSTNYMPGPSGNGRYIFTPTDEELQLVEKRMNYDLKIPDNFCRTVEPFNPSESRTKPQQPKSQINPQTTQFCDTLGIDDPLSLAMLINGHELSFSSTLDGSGLNDSSLISEQSQSSLTSSIDAVSPLKRKSVALNLPKPVAESNQEEVSIDDSDDNDEGKDLNGLSQVPEVAVETSKTDQESETNVVETTAEDDSSANVPIKKFKRRNQCIYAEDDDDKQ